MLRLLSVVMVYYSGSGYSMTKRATWCFVILTALSRKKVKWSKGESAFVSRGYRNWKDVVMAFKKHEGLDCSVYNS